MLTPAETGLPPKFSTWRPGQDSAIDRISDAFTLLQYVAMAAPVGAGKTIMYVALALAMGWRVCFVTSTKGLQDQLIRDFGAIGLVDVRGRNNYDCGLGAPGEITCEEGSHMRCSLSKMPGPGMRPGGMCGYRGDVERALRAQLVTTNYKYWMLAHMFGEGLGKFDLLVCDEAHEAPEEVCAAMAVIVRSRDVNRLLRGNMPDNPLECGIEKWADWAKFYYPRAMTELESHKTQGGEVGVVEAKRRAMWAKLARTLGVLAEAEGPWAAELQKTGDGTAYKIEPLWPQQYTRKILFRDIEHVLLVSATVRPMTMELLGLKPEEYDFQEYPYIFPIRRSPIIHVPTVSCRKDMSGDDWALIERRIDQLVGKRLDRRGLIHTPSYWLADQIKEYCDFGYMMMTHERNSTATREAVRQFKLEPPPTVLLSPSVGTGYDFPYRDAEYQIIPKLPFVVTATPIMEARCRKKKGGNPAYADYLMVQSLTQQFGRTMRASDDQSETFILDDNFFWVKKKLRQHFPAWVWPLLSCRDNPPDPPPPLEYDYAKG